MNKKPILFSIVVPVYNVEKFLDQCIVSILQQTYKNFELILVDDGSTDKSPSICDEYVKKDSRVVVMHKQNGGLVSARKAGITIAKGDYAVCVDSDDWIDRTHLQELSNIIDEFAPDIICFNHYKIIEGNKILVEIPYQKGLYAKSDLENVIYPCLIQTNKGKSFPPAIWAKSFKMDIYREEQLLIDDRIKIGEDAACTIPCMIKASNIYILDKPLYYYRHNSDSMTKNKKPFSWKTAELIEMHLRKRIDVNGYDFQAQILRRTVHALIKVVITQFYCNEKYSVIKRNIYKELSRPIYKNALKQSEFKKGSQMFICKFFLTNNLYFPFYLLSKIK